ncbi:MAG: tetraacyldisaccharide 4'-kinase [Alphaproteobacteria bacterium]|nr:tetraacyldisaccharide 4'-kinase [Alphaproteobacteria bacterium]
MKTPQWFLRKGPTAFLLMPISWLYFAVGRVVYWGRTWRAIKSRRPIICVGNILAGGVGKTPVVRAIANYFGAPVVMRGYKKSDKTGNVGDEATMLARTGLAVHVGDRKSNIILLNKQLNEKGPIVMDDGLQNPTIKKDISLLVFDEGLGYGNGFLLPSGPLRVPKSAAEKADAIIVIKNKKPNKKFVLPVGVPVFFAKNQTVSPYDDDEKLVAFAGIGYPKKFFNSLRNVVARRAFADHYEYTDEDLKKLFALAEKKKAKLITTEKDWVRLPVEIRDKIKYARLDTVIDNNFYDWLKEKIKCLHSNKK